MLDIKRHEKSLDREGEKKMAQKILIKEFSGQGFYRSYGVVSV
jgi:hypothetical protein